RQRLGGDVRPCGTAVARDPDEAVVGAGPEQALLHRRLGKRENRVVVLDRSDVERDRSSRGMLLALVVARQVLADGGPAHAALVAEAGDANAAVVLLRAVDVIRKLAVGDDVVELRRRLVVHGAPGLAAVHADGGAAIVAVDDAFRVSRINPQAVMVAVWRGQQG